PITAAPEQLYKRIIPASDQFSLAVLLYFWLTGRPPYIGSSDEIQQLKLTETITPLSSVNPNITIEQDGVVLRALSVSPEDRYQSVQAFADALALTLSPKTRPVFATESSNHIFLNVLNISEQTPQLSTEQISEETQEIEPEAEILLQKAEDSAMIAHLIIFSPYVEEPSIVELHDEAMTIG